MKSLQNDSPKITLQKVKNHMLEMQRKESNFFKNKESSSKSIKEQPKKRITSSYDNRDLKKQTYSAWSKGHSKHSWHEKWTPFLSA